MYVCCNVIKKISIDIINSVGLEESSPDGGIY